VEQITFADVFTFLEDSAGPSGGDTLSSLTLFAPGLHSNAPMTAPTPMYTPPSYLPTAPAQLPVPATSATATPLAAVEPGMSHVCNWPGCGKGFSSRWSLERHVRNHQSATPGEQEQPDSFVERRLRERVKSVQLALEKVKEKLAQHARQQEQAEADLQEAHTQGQRQQVPPLARTHASLPATLLTALCLNAPSALSQVEMDRLAQQNRHLAAELPVGVAQHILSIVQGGTASDAPVSLPYHSAQTTGMRCGETEPDAAVFDPATGQQLTSRS
jgi:hypothetical protein